MKNRIAPYKPTAEQLEREWTGRAPERRSGQISATSGDIAARDMRAKINGKTLLQRLFK